MLYQRTRRPLPCILKMLIAIAAMTITTGCSRVHVGEELSLTCPTGEISCESDQRVILYPTAGSIAGAWDLKKRCTLASVRAWMNEATQSRILPTGTKITVESIETREGKEILRIRTLDDNGGWYIEPKFVRK